MQCLIKSGNYQENNNIVMIFYHINLLIMKIKYLYLIDSPTAGRTILYIPEAELKHKSEQNDEKSKSSR